MNTEKSLGCSNRCRDIVIFYLLGCRPPSSWISLDLRNGPNSREGRTASPCQISSKSLEPRLRYNNLSIFFKMAAVRHLGFVVLMWGPPTKGIWWSLSLCKIWLESMQYSFDLIICTISRVWLENAYSLSKIGFFRGKIGEGVNSTNSTLQYTGNYHPFPQLYLQSVIN